MNGNRRFHRHMIRRALAELREKRARAADLELHPLIRKADVAVAETLEELRRRGEVAFEGELGPETLVTLTAPHIV
jgi:hypothetical protein